MFVVLIMLAGIIGGPQALLLIVPIVLATLMIGALPVLGCGVPLFAFLACVVAIFLGPPTEHMTPCTWALQTALDEASSKGYKIAFISNQNGFVQNFVMDANGNNVVAGSSSAYSEATKGQFPASKRHTA